MRGQAIIEQKKVLLIFSLLAFDDQFFMR
jgi:hypothetical protein